MGAPDAVVTKTRMSGNPGYVKVSVNGEVLWQKDQRRLYRKYGDWRAESQQEIAAAIKKAAEQNAASRM